MKIMRGWWGRFESVGKIAKGTILGVVIERVGSVWTAQMGVMVLACVGRKLRVYVAC